MKKRLYEFCDMCHTAGYAQTHLYREVAKGNYETAEIIDGHWYVDEEEVLNKLPIDKNGNRMIRVADCSSMFACKRGVVEQLVKSGEIKNAKKIGKTLYVSPDEVAKIFPRIKDGYMVSWDYAAIRKVPQLSVIKACRKGEFKTAEKINSFWYIQEDEDLPESLKSELLISGNYIPLRQWAKINSVNYDTIYRAVKVGTFKSAIKVGGVLYLDKNEHHDITTITTDNNVVDFNDDYISITEAANLYGIHRTTIQKQVRKGMYKSAVFYNGLWFIKSDEVKPKWAGLVSVKEYERKTGISVEQVIKYIKNGQTKTGMQNYNGRYYISPNELLPKRASQVLS